MFFINQAIGSMLVHPDWDVAIQWGLRYVTLGVSVYVISYTADVLMAVNTFEGMYG